MDSSLDELRSDLASVPITAVRVSTSRFFTTIAPRLVAPTDLAHFLSNVISDLYELIPSITPSQMRSSILSHTVDSTIAFHRDKNNLSKMQRGFSKFKPQRKKKRILTPGKGNKPTGFPFARRSLHPITRSLCVCLCVCVHISHPLCSVSRGSTPMSHRDPLHSSASLLLDTTMEIHDNDLHLDNNAYDTATSNNSGHRAGYTAKKAYAAVATPPSPRTDSESNQHEEEEDDEDVFRFDAPAYYDLKNPALEAQYVNNADGYFSNEYTPSRKEVPTTDPAEISGNSSGLTPTSSTATPLSAPAIVSTRFNKQPQRGDGESALQTTPAFDRFQQQLQKGQTRLMSSHHEDQQQRHEVQQDTEMVDEQRQQHQLRMSQYREPQKMGAEVADEDDDDERMSDAGSEDTLVLETSEDMHIEELSSNDTAQETQSLSRSRLYDDKEETFEEVFAQYASSSHSSSHSMAHLLQEPSSYPFSPHSSHHSSHHEEMHGLPPAPRSTGYAPRGSSKLMQPTQSYLRRIHTEHAIREQSYMEGAPLEDKPFRLTQPKGPKLLTSKKAEQAYRDPKDPSRLSYTSRELLKIQEERLRVQMETMKIREFHEKTRAQRPPANVHQRSTKQLTIPVSPYLEVGHRTRRFHQSESGASDDGSAGNSDRERPHQVIRPETLLTRDFSLPVTQHHDSHELTVSSEHHCCSSIFASV